MKDKEKLIHDLIFNYNKKIHEISVGDYIKDIYEYDEFIEGIRKILFRSKVMLISEKVKVTENDKQGISENPILIIWTINTKK